MGASQSVSAHHSHREGWQHRLKRVGKNEVRAMCGMCSRYAEMGEAAYRCRSCGFVVHETCYRLPKKINHFAHSGGHPLTLCDRSRAPAGAPTSCSICAVAFGAAEAPSYFVYGCTRCHGFYAHPRCCSLPQTMHNSGLHQHALTLLPPPRARRRCLNLNDGKCRNAKRWLKNDAATAAWSYECSTCDVEVCLACQMPPGGDGPSVPPEEDNRCGDVIRAVGAVAADLGNVLLAVCNPAAAIGIQPLFENISFNFIFNSKIVNPAAK